MIARRLAEGGIDPYYGETDDSISVVPLIEGSVPTVIRARGVRRLHDWMIFFGAQGAVARKWRAQLESWKQDTRIQTKQLRMGVFSAGWIQLDELAAKIRTLRLLLRRVAQDRKLRRWGVNLIFGNMETVMWRQCTGAVRAHLHSHIGLRCRRYLGPRVWRMVLARLRQLNTLKPGQYHDAGYIRNFEELTKYMTKATSPMEVDAAESASGARRIGLLNLSTSELVAYHKGILGCKRFMAYGELKKYRSRLDKARVVTRTTRRIDNLETGESIDKTVEQATRVQLARDSATGRWKLFEGWPRDLRPEYDKKPSEREDIVLGLTFLALRAADGVLRLAPALRMLNMTGATVEALCERRGLEHLLKEATALWRARIQAEEATASKKHTSGLSCSTVDQSDHTSGPRAPPD
jgi:hypothetical protein